MTPINLLLSMLGPNLTDEQSGLFAQIGQWTVLNERNGRLFVDAVGPEAAIAWVLQTLAGAMQREPLVIGGWHFDGRPVDGYPLDEAAWLAVAPDILDRSDPQAQVRTRPREFSDIHRWAGWAPKQGPQP